MIYRCKLVNSKSGKSKYFPDIFETDQLANLFAKTYLNLRRKKSLYILVEEIMEFSSYQEKAVSTAIYPEKYEIIYPALGLGGESGEVLEKVKKFIRDDNCVMTDDRRSALKKELGDCLWYLANLANDLGLSLNDIASANLQKLAARKEKGTLQGSGDDR